jgi:death-on-curing protein
LDRDDVEFVAHKLAARLFTNYGDPLPAFQLFGGLREGGGLLESALGLPRQPYYRSIYDKAGAMLRSLIKNHPLVDGNKRVGMATTLVFLGFNRHLLIASNEEMVRFALEIAASEPDMPYQDVARWLRQRCVRAGTSSETARQIQARLPREWNEPQEVMARVKDYITAIARLRAELDRDR